MYGALPLGYGDYGANCAKINKRLARAQSRLANAKRRGQKRRRARRVGKLQAKAERKGCIVSNGQTAQIAPADALPIDAAYVAPLPAGIGGGGTSQQTWLLGGLAVAAVLGVALVTTAPKGKG
jgi:hypothetical protein